MFDITSASIARTLKSYRDGVAPFFEISPRLSTEGGGSGPALFIPTRFACDGHRSLNKATRIVTQRAGLMDYSRPKIIGEREHIWRDSFFTVRVYVDSSFEYFEHDQGGYREDGKRERPRLRSRDQSLSLFIASRSWGLADWRPKMDTIRCYLDRAPSEVRATYSKAVLAAEAEVMRWEDAMKSLVLSVPTLTPGGR
jgi:hypothetical protein